MSADETKEIKVTKKIIRNLLDEYAMDGDKPTSPLGERSYQNDPRLPEHWDKTSVVNELHAHLRDAKFTSIVELRRRVRDALRNSELHANTKKRHRVIDQDVSHAMNIENDVVSRE